MCSRKASQYFKRLESSTEAERLVRKIDMMMASPTTTSAAATTITKNAMICPSSVPLMRENVTSARLAAFSISSMHMNTTIALRRTSTPTVPIEKRIAESNTYQLGLTAHSPPWTRLHDRDRFCTQIVDESPPDHESREPFHDR